ncbi:hypothetical protein [Streptomyces sp. NPDC057729]|uniref:hypothetical protein n=1 Tax=Streptomyces sp. NPDC057729 TaxID=3346230 RepID=UPI0036CA1326
MLYEMVTGRQTTSAEELLQRGPGREDPQPEITSVARPVESIDRGLHHCPEPAVDLPGVPLLDKREVCVDVVDLLAIRRPPALSGPGEVVVQVARLQLPGHELKEVADLDHRFDQLVDRSWHQPSGIPRPLVLGKGVQKEPFGVRPAHLCGTAPPERHHVGETRFTGRRSVDRCASGDDQQVSGIGICHEHAD